MFKPFRLSVFGSLGSLHRGRGGKETAPSRHPEFSRSMSSDNWREAKKRDADTETGVSWRSRQDHSKPGISFCQCLFH